MKNLRKIGSKFEKKRKKFKKKTPKQVRGDVLRDLVFEKNALRQVLDKLCHVKLNVVL